MLIGAEAERPHERPPLTKEPAHSDVLYVDELIGRDVVNTLSEQALQAFADRGEVAPTLDTDPAGPEQVLAELARTGIKLDALTAEREREGVQSFCDSYRQLLGCINTKPGAVTPTAARG